jgi:hypothetical protein
MLDLGESMGECVKLKEELSERLFERLERDLVICCARG